MTKVLGPEPGLPLAGRVAVVTGVGRRQGIGHAIAVRLVEAGASLLITHFSSHDAEQPWGADTDAVLESIRSHVVTNTQRVIDLSVDLAEEGAPETVFARALEAFDHVDILICAHARSGGDGRLGELSAAMLDAHWAVNTRSSLLLTQEFARQHDGRRGGRVVLMTSGQQLGPMPGEIAYASSKAALAGITLTLADQLADEGITVNCVNPGPVNTGYMTPEFAEELVDFFPFGRIGVPDDPARLIAWLVGDEGEWMTGQVLNSEGGFARWRSPSR